MSLRGRRRLLWGCVRTEEDEGRSVEGGAGGGEKRDLYVSLVQQNECGESRKGKDLGTTGFPHTHDLGGPVRRLY